MHRFRDLGSYAWPVHYPTGHGGALGERPCTRRSAMYGSMLAQRDLLRRSPLFSCLGDKETDAMLLHATVTRYAAGADIFAQGDPGISMMAVLKVRVQISAPSAD